MLDQVLRAAGGVVDRRASRCRCPGCGRASRRLPAHGPGGPGRIRPGGWSRRWPGRSRMPPPARKAQLTCGQWSRPASLLIRGVRPNSPQAMTVTSFEHAAGFQVFDQGAEALIELDAVIAHQVEVVAVAVPAAVGQRSRSARPASTSRRAISRCSLSVGAPSYWNLKGLPCRSARGLAGSSLLRSRASSSLLRGQHVERPLGERIEGARCCPWASTIAAEAVEAGPQLLAVGRAARA